MKTPEEIKKIEANVKSYLADGLFQKGDYRHLTDFYLQAAKKTLLTADSLYQLSENKKLKKEFKLLEDFETYLWVITTAYYAMFYAVNALCSKHGLKMGGRIVHKVTGDVFYYYFVRNNKIAKEMFLIYEEAQEQALNLTATEYPRRAEELAENLEWERNKRHKFQYNTTEMMKKSYAQTSLQRAIDFVNQVEILIK